MGLLGLSRYSVEVCDYLDIFDYRDIIRLIKIRIIGLLI